MLVMTLFSSPQAKTKAMLVIIFKARGSVLLYPKAAGVTAAAVTAATTGDDVHAVMVSVISVLFVDLPATCLYSFVCWISPA